MIKKLLSSKWAKIVLACILAAVIAIVFFTYWEQKETEENTNTKSIAEKVDNEETLTEEAAFFETSEALKRQANAANGISQWPEKRNAILDIGEKLKEILDSDNADLLTNDTFTSDEFSVDITDYPLHSKIIRRITYTLKDNDDDIQRMESYFFLQYIGETTFFSDIEYTYTNAGIADEHEFQVFENADGCFIFLISSGYEYTTFNPNEKIMDYYVRIYIPRENEFYVKESIEIPLRIASGQSVRLVQQDNTIKGIISGYQNEPEFIFNSLELTFELPRGNLESEPVDYDMPGLLLGLSDSKGNIRTLFIRKEGDRVCADEYAGQIIISRQDKLFSIKPYILYEDFYEDEIGNEDTVQTGNIDIKKLLCAPLGIDLTDEFNKIFKSTPHWGYYAITDIPLYIGEDYICYIQNSYESGGGTYQGDASNIRFDKLDNLADFILDGWLSPNFKEITLADLIYGKKAEELYKEDIHTYGGILQPYIDFRQLSIKRNLGKWSFMLPITEEYYHPGNGSYFKNITAFAAYDNDVPNFLITNNEVMELGGWSNWDAKDFLKFPESEVTLIQHNYFIGIRCGEDSLEDYDLSIPINLDEYIVSINFADKDTQKAWISEYFNGKPLLEINVE